MGAERYDSARDKVGKAKTFHEKTYEAAPTYDIFFYHHGGSIALNQGEGGEIQLTVPPGNYEIEAHAQLFNNSNVRAIYSCSLEFYLDDFIREIWEGGELGSTADSRPYHLLIKTISTFKKTKTIKFSLGGNAPFGFLAALPTLTVKRVGAVKFEFF